MSIASVDAARMSPSDYESRKEDLALIYRLEEKENLEAKHWRALSYEPRFFHWCFDKSRAQETSSIKWYKLCQIENSDGTCDRRPMESARIQPREGSIPDGEQQFAVKLGRRMCLTRVGNTILELPRTAIASEISFRTEIDFSSPSGLALEPSAVTYELRSTDQDIAFTGQGSDKSYGLFGAPGSGKTRLMLQMLKQIFAHENANRQRRFGALILDPKAALINEVREKARAAGRSEDDVQVLNVEEMQANQTSVNVLNCSMDKLALGRFLVTVARSAGTGAKEPYWFNVMGDLLGAALHLLDFHERPAKPTLKSLVKAILNASSGKPRLKQIMEKEKARLTGNTPESWRIALDRVERFYSDDKTVTTVTSLISKAFGIFETERFACFSDSKTSDSLYDSIIKDGKIVLVSPSPLDPDGAKTICTLVKCLFQQTVLGRGEKHLAQHKRPVVLACDEFSVIATELPGEAIGDGYFFALARENGCMGLLATQSVHTLENSSMEKSWRAVYSNFAAKIFMRCADPETAEEACRLAGASDWETTSPTFQSTGTSSDSVSREKRDHLLPRQLMMLKQRQAVVIGTLDGGQSTPVLEFFEVPREGRAIR